MPPGARTFYGLHSLGEVGSPLQKIIAFSGPKSVCLILLECDLFVYLRYAPVVVKKCH